MAKARNNRDAIFNDLKPAELEETLVRTCKITSARGVRERVKYELGGKEEVYIKQKDV